MSRAPAGGDGRGSAENPAMRVARLREGLHQAGSMLARGRGEVDDGRIPDLAPIAPLIDRLTAEVGELSPGEGRPLRPALLALLDEMAQLSQRLIEERDRLGLRLRGQPERERARAAYRDRNKA